MIIYNALFSWSISLIFGLLDNGPSCDRLRGILYQPFLKDYGSNLKISSSVKIYSPNMLTVGQNVYIGHSSYLGNGEIDILDNVMIGPFVSITPSNHTRISNSYRYGNPEFKKIVIEDGVWIGAHASILAGIKVASGSMVAAGAVLTKKFPKNSIVGGIPAKVIQRLSYNL